MTFGRSLLALIALVLLVQLASADNARAQRARTDGYAEGEGVRLYFVQQGEGPLILFLHGAPDSWALYEPLLAEFARDHLAVAPNLRGFPPSDAPDRVDAYAMRYLLGDVHRLLRHFGKRDCVLVGNDWGGYVAWVFASAYPKQVRRLVVLNAPHPAIHLREVRTNRAQNGASQYERAYHDAPALFPAWYNYYRADPIKVPESIEAATAMIQPDLAAHFLAGLATPPATTSLRITVPTLVIWGMRDPALLPGQLDGLDLYASDLRVVRIDDAGHYPMRSHLEIVRRSIREFLR